MKDIIVKYEKTNDLRNVISNYDDYEMQKLWESFIAFFRHIKGYSDWGDEDIALSMNEDDLKEYFEWARKVFDL